LWKTGGRPIASLLIRSGHLDLSEIGITAAGSALLSEYIKALLAAFNDEFFLAIVAMEKHRRIVDRQYDGVLGLAIGALSGLGCRHDSPPFVCGAAALKSNAAFPLVEVVRLPAIQQGLQSVGQLGAGLQADKAFFFNPVLEDDDGGNALNPQPEGHFLMLIHVQDSDCGQTAKLFLKRSDDRFLGPAGPAPMGVEIDKGDTLGYGSFEIVR
jgi:hypothetical protein